MRNAGAGKRECSIAAAILAACLLAAVPARAENFLLVPIRGMHHANEHQEIERLENKWRSAVLAGDETAMASMLADSYIGIGPDGTISNRNEELAARADGQQHLQQLNVLERRIRLFGSTAVVTSKVDLQGVYSGQPLLGEYRYTRVWTLQRGQWKIVSFEASRVHDTSARSQ